MGDLLSGMTGWLTANPSWVAVAIFVVAFTECVAIVGIVVPGTVIMFAIAALLLGFLGGLLGDAVSYFIGRRFHQNIRQLPGLRTHPEWMAGAETYFHRYGIASLLVGRFIGPLRTLCGGQRAGGRRLVDCLPDAGLGAVVGAGLAILFGLSIQSSIRQKRYATKVISALSLILVAALFIGWPYLADFDNGLMTLVQEHRSEAAQNIVLFVTSIGDFKAQLLAASLLIIVLAVARQWRHAAFALTVTLGTAIENGTLKTFFARARPEVLLDPITSYSMPSGHSSAAFALFMNSAVLASRGQPVRLRLTWMLVCGIPALAIALSRVYLGVHWPTDILAGMLLAFCVCAASLAFFQRKQSLSAMSVRVWWLIVPAMTALLGIFAVRALSHAVLRYQY